MATKKTTAVAKRYNQSTELTHNGKTQSVKDWAIETGLSPGTLLERLNVSGWDVSKSLTLPPDSQDNRPLSVGRQLKEGLLARIQKAIERNSAEVEQQIDDAVKHNLFQLLKEISNLLPKEQLERAEKTAGAVGIKIELVGPTPPTVNVTEMI